MAAQMKLYLGGHTVCEQHGVALVNGHIVVAHDILNLGYDELASCLNAKVLPHLHDVIRHAF